MSQVSRPRRRADSISSGFAVGLIALTALTLVYISFLFEREAFTVLLGSFGTSNIFPGSVVTLAEALAFGLNGAKIGLPFIIVQMSVVDGKWALVPRLLRILILILSLLMTLVIVSGQTISPQAEARLEAFRAEATDNHEAELTALGDETAQQLARISERFAAELTAVRNTSATRIVEWNAQRDVERGIGGQDFKGTRYEDLERLILDEQNSSAKRLDELRREELTATAAVTQEAAGKRTGLEQKLADKLRETDFDTVYASTEAQNPYVLKFVSVLRQFIESNAVNPVLITIGLSVLISLLIEVTPMTLFGYLYRTFTVAQAPEEGENEGSAVNPAEAAVSENIWPPEGRTTSQDKTSEREAA